ncbi:glycosyltransferase family 2 protein [Flavobacterium arcticum]|uniref:Glycosyltransferase family 2 protein n=1 Tax=Flavobacterium arcticum TaxID=1784713 RepID=A0A345H8W8_9FLAO|nr:glycosyltransferase family 2 protein [Flavobacterium arcticum]AXG73028.1 glycosyltransferase family 2 protein [Flavobacterium arcticum]KAF2510308.1 glycosyltransferase family 2 protein [Flavobacterium arcticum]
MNKKVFVVIVTYNGAHWVDRNISSLLQSDYPVTIIVIDNCSTDNTVALLDKYEEVSLIQANENLGFGKGNNIGIQKALAQGADYVFLLNQDAWVFNNTISSLIAKMEKDSKLGILSPMHYSGNGKSYDTAFSTYLSRSYSDLQYINSVAVPFVNAAAWMMSRKCIERVGFFEPLFGHYGEDRNYCDRVKYHGFLIGIDLDAKIIHDRVITRNLKKDIIQSKYKILATLLDINHSFSKSRLLALKEVVGLPKYFSKFYGVNGAINLFLKLITYYFNNIFNSSKIKKARRKSAVNG